MMSRICFSTVLLATFGFLGNISATDVGGIINSSATWNLAASPYNITSTVQIAYGAILSIDPGVIVSNGTITVFGQVSAIGTSTSRVHFENVALRGGANNSAQPFLFNLKFCHFRGGAVYPATGGGCYGSLILEDSFLEYLTAYLYVWYPTGDCSIQRNVFVGTAISSGHRYAVAVSIVNNVFYGWRTDVAPYSAIENWASLDTSRTIAVSNSFLSTDRVALRLEPGSSSAGMIATNNFWSTTDIAVISSMIYDRNDDLSCANYITYFPILTSPGLSVATVPLPTFTVQPTNQAVNSGANVVFTASASGVGNLLYQWQLNGTSLPGKTNSTLALLGVTMDQAGQYTVKAANFAGGTTISQTAYLAVRNPPVIESFSPSQTLSPGGSVHLSVSATGTGGLSYQWQLNGYNILGATNPELTITNVSALNAGVYTVVVTDGIGGASAASAVVSVFGMRLMPVLSVAGGIGSRYQIEYADAITGTNNWLYFTSFSLPYSPYYIIDTQAESNSRFYRAVLLP
jgi:hypothetical protein